MFRALFAFVVAMTMTSTVLAQKNTPLQAPSPVQAPSKLSLAPQPQPQVFSAPVPLAAPLTTTLSVPVTTFQSVPVTTFQQVPVTTFQQVEVPVPQSQQVSARSVARFGGCFHPLQRMKTLLPAPCSRSVTTTRTVIRT